MNIFITTGFEMIIKQQAQMQKWDFLHTYCFILYYHITYYSREYVILNVAPVYRGPISALINCS